MPSVRPAYLSDTFFFLNPETRLESLLNAERFTRSEPSRLSLAVSTAHLQPDRLTTVAAGRSGRAALALTTRFEATRRTGWIATVARSNDPDSDFGALIDETVRRVGLEGLYNCAATLDSGSDLCGVFYRSGFIPRGTQTVYSGPAAAFLDRAGSGSEIGWRSLNGPAALDPFQRFYWRRLRDYQGTAAPYYRRGCRMYGLSAGKRITGFAAVTGSKRALYIEIWLTAETGAAARAALTALIVFCGAERETRLSICVPERQPLLNDCAAAEYRESVIQTLYLKQLTAPVSRRSERTVESFSDLTVATIQDIDLTKK